MRPVKTPPPEAKALLKEASKALASKGLIQPFLCGLIREDGVELVKVRSSQPIPLPYGDALPGVWTLHAEWLLRPVPVSKELVLWRSSVGLTVQGLPGDELSGCVIRYDVDNERIGPGAAPLGRHINVLQPAPLLDHVHYPVFHDSNEPWPVAEILELFQSVEFISDLAKRLAA